MKLYPVISEALWFSSRTHQLGGSWDVERLLGEYKITFVINLWHTADPRLVNAGCRGYLHIPMPDGQMRPEVVSEAHYAAAHASLALGHGERVLIHCWGGRNRSGLVVALTLVRHLGISGAEAAARVRTARPGALANEHFRNYLENLL